MRSNLAKPFLFASVAAVSLIGGNAFSDSPAAPPAGEWSQVGLGNLDALAFFERLVARYRDLTVYSDLTHIIEVTRQYGDEEPHRTETRVTSELRDGTLKVVTPGSQLRRSFGLDLPLQLSEAFEQQARAYELWLLPHLTLKFAEKPLEEFREGVSEGFTATEAAEVTIDDKPMVHLELTSGDGLSGDYNARYDLYVDPSSMLIERIEGRQRLPNGGDCETTYDIRPTASEGGESWTYTGSIATSVQPERSTITPDSGCSSANETAASPKTEAVCEPPKCGPVG